MRKAVLLLFTLSLFVPLQAQRVWNKPFDVTLRKYGVDEIIRLFGKPERIDTLGETSGISLVYPHVSFDYCETFDGHNHAYQPDGFQSDSPDFCILSKYFPSGIRVGDSLERLEKLDIVHSKPGKGREGNGLRRAEGDSSGKTYIILGEEYNHYYLTVVDGIVQSIDWSTPRDWAWAQGGILWRIEGESLPAPSYILGTFPHASADFCRHVAGLERIWKSVKTIYREDPDLGPWGRTIPDDMFLPDGKELSSLYKWEEYGEIQDYVRKVTGFRPESLWWTPEGLTRFLRNELMEQALPELADGMDDMSAYLYKKALAEGKEVHTLPALLPNSDKGSLLQRVKSPEGNPDSVKDYILRVYEAYLSQDMDEIGWRMVRESSAPFSPPMMTYGLDPWSEILEQAILKEPTLVIMDVSYLISWYGMMDLFGHEWFRYRFHSMKPTQKD